MANKKNSKTNKKNPVRSNSTSQKIKKVASLAKQVMTNPVVSKNGTAAIDSKGTLSNIGNFIGKAAGLASKFLPGVGGVIASGVADLLNDPEWWESVPGQQITCNEPLARVSLGDLETEDTFQNIQAFTNRPVYGEFVTKGNATAYQSVINISDQTMNQYVMPAIRKVMQSVPLQDASDYKDVLSVNITLYAIHKHLERMEFLARNGKPYLPNFDTVAHPILQTTNFAQLQALNSKLREHLRANVRLPHTICEYLAWRFGRIYKSNDSEKSSLIIHTPIHSIHGNFSTLQTTVSNLMNFNSLVPTRQKAQQDLSLVYASHVQDVPILASTQFKYDKKEFMLRLNCDMQNLSYSHFGDANTTTDTRHYDQNKTPGYGTPNAGMMNFTSNPVVIDSSLDNATVFMASTISTKPELSQPAPFPVVNVYCARYCGSIPAYKLLGYQLTPVGGFTFNELHARINMGISPNDVRCLLINGRALSTNSTWLPSTVPDTNFSNFISTQANYEAYMIRISQAVSGYLQRYLGYELMQLSDAKSLDIYNIPYLVVDSITIPTMGGQNYPWFAQETLDPQVNPATAGSMYDISSLAIDLGTCTETVLDNEHVYALANLLFEKRTKSESRTEAEKEIAQEFVDTLQDTDVILKE